MIEISYNGRPPDFVSRTKAVWVLKDKHGRKYLKIVEYNDDAVFHVDDYRTEPTEPRKAEFMSADELLE